MAETSNNGYPVDSEIVVTVPTDFTAAYMIIYPPKNGGKEPTFEKAMAALRAKAVSFNINEELLRKVIEAKIYEKEFKAAEAILPVNGTDGTITYKYSKENKFVPDEDENGFVDYKNLGFIKNIHENDTIADIVLPTQGTHGTDVRGVAIPAVPGEKARYSVGSGTRVSDDGTRIYALWDGHVFFKDNAFCVDSKVTINGDVDASVGNIDFAGDVIIKGEVLEGFRVSSGKNVTIMGNVTNAEINAGCSVTIKKGSINSKIVAHGDINCDFCEYSDISTDGSINVQNFVMCTVYCGGDVKAKSLSGGKYTILGNAEVGSLGTKNYVATDIIMGDNALLSAEKAELAKQTAECDSKIDRCNQVVDFLNEKRKELKRLPEDKEELLGSMVKTKLACQMEKKKAEQRIKEIDALLSQLQNRSIICKGTVYPGVNVIINRSVQKFAHEISRVHIHLDENGSIIATSY